MPAVVRKRVLAGVSAAAVLAALTFFLFRPDPVVDTPRYPTEKSKRSKIEGYADRFAAYHDQIRTAVDGAGLAYPSNYAIVELARARVARKRGGVALPWVERGPGNVSGRTRAIVVDAADPTHRTWIAGAVSGGLWKTNDAGESWVDLAPDLPNLAISALAQAPSNPKIIYAGTGEGHFNIGAVAGAGIFKSVDGGDTWMQLEATATAFEHRFVNSLIVDPKDENVVIAATNTGIYRSADGGVQWTEAYGISKSDVEIGSGRVQDLVSQPDNFNVQLAGLHGRGIGRSTDGGRTWTLVEHSIFGGFGRVALAFAPSDPSRVYAAVDNVDGSDIHMSTDAGLSWIPLVEEATYASADWLRGQGWYDNVIAVHPFDADSVFVGGIELWKINVSDATRQVQGVNGVDEIDTGSFLSFVNFGGAEFRGALQTGDKEGAIEITNDDFVTVELRFGPGKSQRAHRFIPDDGPGILLNTYPFANYAEVPFEAWDMKNNRQLAVSFRDRLHDGVFDLIPWDEGNVGREYIFIHAVSYDPELPNPNIAKTGGTIYKMLYFTWPILSDGATWQAENLPESMLRINYSSFVARLRTTSKMKAESRFGERVHVDHHNITIVPLDEAANEYMVVNGNDGGVYVTMDSGSSWDKASTGYNTTQFYGVDKKPGLPVYIGGTQDNGTWSSLADPTAASRWTHRIGGDGFAVEWHDENPQLVLGSVYFNYIQRSVDGGLTFEDAYSGQDEVNPGLQDHGEERAPFLTELATSPADPDLVFAIGKTGVWRSEDFGATWAVRRIPPAQWGFHNGGRVAVSLTNPDVVWAGFYMDGTRQLHVSTDRGRSFAPTTSSELAPGFISGLAADPHDDKKGYVLFSAYGRAKILRTRDLGASWEDLSGFGDGASTSSNGFPNVAVHDLLVLPDRDGEIWVGTEIGLFISQDDGASWQSADNGLPAVSIWEIRVVDDEIVVATHGRGVWSLPLSAVPVGSESSQALPSSFALHPNYPNPFNPSTTISFDVPAASRVRLTVFDVAGRHVSTLTNEPFGAGRHNVEWDAGGVASGMYFVRMQSGDFSATQAVTLVK